MNEQQIKDLTEKLIAKKEEAERLNVELRVLLNPYWDLVAPKTHWKDPIDRICREKDGELIARAIEYFTATEAKIEKLSGQPLIRVRSIGYRAGPAGDN